MSKRCLILIWLVVVSLIGCTTIPLYPIVKERVMVADFDSTWKATIAALEEEKFPIEYFDEDRGIIKTKRLHVSGEVVKAISQGYRSVFSEPDEGEYNLKLKVERKDPGRTSVRIDAYIRAYFPEYGWYVKSSSGAMEERIFSSIMERLGQYEILHKWF